MFLPSKQMDTSQIGLIDKLPLLNVPSQPVVCSLELSIRGIFNLKIGGTRHLVPQVLSKMLLQMLYMGPML